MPYPRPNPRLPALAAAALLALAAVNGAAQAPAPAAAAASAPANPLQGAQRIGSGQLAAYRQGASTLVVLAPATLARPLLWYTELVALPAGMVVGDTGLEVGNALVRFEQRGPLLHVRDLSTVQMRRAGGRLPSAPEVPQAKPAQAGPGRDSVHGSAAHDAKLRPIDVAVGSMETGPVIASFPIKGQLSDGSLVIDVTATFSGDIPALTARGFVASSGRVPLAVDPSHSYIDGVRSRGDNLAIRSHITYQASVAKSPALGPQPVSVVLGHSWVPLPEKPMAARPLHPRVGYFATRYTQFESETGRTQEDQTLIARFRLEKANPLAAVSDPIKPITYYLGPGVPERWRPYLKAGVLQWLPVFEAAGFSNAIRVLDAPTPQQDPDWSPEDVTLNVIRWVPEEHINAMGPHVVDPRSGETLSAHILIWPQVLEYFSQYYWAMFGGGLDAKASRLPLSTEQAGALLSYIVAHEVGHTLGLRHNQIASTAYTVAQLRSPAFANRHGPNSSIMAYGRFNYVAQPGDGVTQFWGVAGPYDYAAIRYGYGEFGSDPATARRALAEFGDSFGRDRRLYYGSMEGGELLEHFGRDPRVQTENVGAERVPATRLGIANLQRSLQGLDAATAGNEAMFRSTYNVILGRHVALLDSVHSVIGAVMPPLGVGEGPRAAFSSAAEQREAVRFLLGEGAASLEPYAQPAVVERASVYGGYRAINRLQQQLVGGLLNGPNLALLESQRRRDPAAYSSLDLGRDVTTLVWSDLKTANATRRSLQRGYVDAARQLLQAWAEGREAQEAAEALAAGSIGLGLTAGRALTESGDDTVFVAWLHANLPGLHKRLLAASRSAATESDRLHFADMALQVGRLLKLGLS